MAQRVGTDVGGTFTDLVWLADGRLEVHKQTTTPEDQSRALVEGLQVLGVAEEAAAVHGSTVATNALLERRGARTALLTTKGFADVLAIGRQNRPYLYRLSQQRPPPLVPKNWRLEVAERLDEKGNVLVPLDEQAVRDIAERLAEEPIESLAVVFLFSFQDPKHELRAAALIRERLPDLPCSLSSTILPEYREYERTATTVINAYVQPLVARYLDRLDAALGSGRSISVMQSNGGVIGLWQAAEQAARLVLSGPAGGVVGAFGLARQALGGEAPNVLTFDMGGTSTDVALCPGQIPHTAEGEIAGLPLRLPSTEIHTVGAGGGSIARVDVGGVLRVGPESAGARPGPVCYGHGGTAPTVTDAHLVLGRLDPGQFLGGSDILTLDEAAARRVLTGLGRHLNLSAEAAALGVLRVADATMERALRRVSVERGHDPRDFVFVPFGGAGPLHACNLAAALGIRRILILPHPGVLSALGLLLADEVFDASQAILRPLNALRNEPSLLQATASDLAVQVQSVLAQPDRNITFEAELDLRYAGQSYELETPLALPITANHIEAAGASFHERHAQRYGYARPGEPVEVVALRMRGRVPVPPPPFMPAPPADTPVDDARIAEKPVWFDAEAPTRTACYIRERLRHGHCFAGPAIVFQYDTTTVIPPGWQARVDAWRNLWIERDPSPPA